MQPVQQPIFESAIGPPFADDQRLELVLQAAKAGYYEQSVPADDGFFCSASWAKVIGLTPGDLPSSDQFRPWLMDRVHPDDRPTLTSEFEAFVDGRSRSYSVDLRIRHRAGHWIWVNGAVHGVDFDGGGRIRRYIGFMQDITHRKQEEERRDLVIKELQHRSRNMIALVQSLAAFTLKHAKNSIEALSAFTERLQALASVQNLLPSGLDENIELGKIAAEIAGQSGDGRIRFTGPPVLLSPSISTTLAMALFELYTNAVKYGALSSSTGHVTFSWQVVNEAKPRLEIEWREKGGPAVQPPGRRGFGSRMIEKALSLELNGFAEIQFHPDGVICNIALPLSELANQKA